MGGLGDRLLGIVALALIVGFLFWSLAGWRSLGRSSAGYLFRRRNAAALVGLLPCLALTVMALPGLRFLPGWALALAAAGAFLAHAAADPSREGFWHHRRLRPLGALAAVAAAVALGLTLPRPELLPVVFAAAIFHVHQRRGTTLVTRAFEDVDALRLKLLTLEADRRAGAPPERDRLADDRRTRAG